MSKDYPNSFYPYEEHKKNKVTAETLKSVDVVPGLLPIKFDLEDSINALSQKESDIFYKIDDVFTRVLYKYKLDENPDGDGLQELNEAIKGDIESELKSFGGISIDKALKTARKIFSGKWYVTQSAFIDGKSYGFPIDYIASSDDEEGRYILPEKYPEYYTFWRDRRAELNAMQPEEYLAAYHKILEYIGLTKEHKLLTFREWVTLTNVVNIFGEELSPKLLANGNFKIIRQGNLTNSLTKISTTKLTAQSFDNVTKSAAVASGDLKILIENYAEGINADKTIKNPKVALKYSTYRLLDALTVAFTESGAKSPQVFYPLSDYMELCRLSDEKEARKQIKSDLDALYSLDLHFKNFNNDANFRVIDGKGTIKNSYIFISFSSVIYTFLKNSPIMPLPSQYFRLNAHKNPNAPYFLRKIAELKNLNQGKKNDDLIAVTTLLKASPEMPSEEDILTKGNRNTGRIVTTFERDMNSLSETLCWHYCHSKGEPLTEEEQQNLNYNLFKTLLVKIDWIDYPDRTEYIQKRDKMAELRKAEKQKTAPKRKRGKRRATTS